MVFTMIGKKAYVASGLENIEEALRIISFLRSFGVENTYDWTSHGPAWPLGRDRVAEVSRAELDGVAAADFVVVRLPGGRGTHVEMGAALALRRPVVIYGGKEKFLVDKDCCAFYHHPGVLARVTSDAELLRAVSDVRESLEVA